MKTNPEDLINSFGATQSSEPNFSGLTKREYFAAMAMQGLLANLSHIRRDGFKDSEIPEFARMQADSLINELNK